MFGLIRGLGALVDGDRSLEKRPRLRSVSPFPCYLAERVQSESVNGVVRGIDLWLPEISISSNLGTAAMVTGV
jgi:hypothetical protein